MDSTEELKRLSLLVYNGSPPFIQIVNRGPVWRVQIGMKFVAEGEDEWSALKVLEGKVNEWIQEQKAIRGLARHHTI